MSARAVVPRAPSSFKNTFANTVPVPPPPQSYSQQPTTAKKRKRPTTTTSKKKNNAKGNYMDAKVAKKAKHPAEAKNVCHAVMMGLSEPNKLICFTDGACKGNPGQAGSGAALITQAVGDSTTTKQVSLPAPSTNNIAELTALGLGLLICAEAHRKNPQKTKWQLWTDSKYSRGVLGLGWKRNANVELLAFLDAFLNECRKRLGVTIEIEWTPGHSDVPWNEQVDKLACEAKDKQAHPLAWRQQMLDFWK